MHYIEIRLPFDHSDLEFKSSLKKKGIHESSNYYIIRKSIDARNKRRIDYVYNISIENPYLKPDIIPLKINLSSLPVIVGLGPAGIFAAFWLLKHGVPSIILEQGDNLSIRQQKIASFMKNDVLDEMSNICFGEGGAGAFSDGKLMTRIKSPYVNFIMDTLIEFGAPEEIRSLGRPHLGSNGIRKVFSNIIQYLKDGGVKVLYRTRLEKIEIETKKQEKILKKIITDKGDFLSRWAFIAPGNSARGLFYSLYEDGVHMEFKPFAAGVRVEHPSDEINRIIYGEFAGRKELGAANYSFAHTFKDIKRGVYSFCMCPGGYLLNSATENGGVSTNGMSNSERRGKFSNAAFVVSVNDQDLDGDPVFKGIEFQRQLEEKFSSKINKGCFTSKLPAQMLPDFLNDIESETITESSSPYGLISCPVHNIFPDFLIKNLKDGMKIFEKKMPGFLSKKAVLIAPETRTSSPLRVIRNSDSFESVSVKGLFPIGEGSGYAGGITSSAVDGIKAAGSFIEMMRK